MHRMRMQFLREGKYANVPRPSLDRSFLSYNFSLNNLNSTLESFRESMFISDASSECTTVASEIRPDKAIPIIVDDD